MEDNILENIYIIKRGTYFLVKKSCFTMVLLDEEADPQLTCFTVPLWQQDPPQGEADLT